VNPQSNNKHIPVLLNEVLNAIQPLLERHQSPILIADGTLGGGGHTEALLKLSPKINVLGCDIDETAIDLVENRLASFVENKNLDFFHGSFVDIPENENGYDGILVDLGYSSNQLENPDYGMSFMKEGPLDMRLSRPATGPTAWDLLNTAPENWLVEVFKSYGEIQIARKLVAAMRQDISNGTITDSTRSFAGWLEKKFPSLGRGHIHPATTVFQALRIATNDELRVLDRFLKTAILKLRKGGRLLVITFHSLEDRIVKQNCQKAGSLKAVYSKAIAASDEEIRMNPRSRSAKLRVYERTS